jgi:AraC-like DNA-binding protein
MNRYFRVAGRLGWKLEELGVPVDAVLRHAGLKADLFSETRVLVTTQQLFALWRAVGAVSRDPAIGLKLGVETKTERFHPSAIAALSSENFIAAVAHMARYKQLTCPEEMLSDVEGNEWKIRFRWTLAVDREPQVLVEYCFAWMQTIGRHGSGEKIVPLRIELVEPRAHVKLLERHFGCEVVMGAAENAMVFRAKDALLPFQTRNAELLEMLAPRFDEELKRVKEQDSLSERVYRAIHQRLTGNRPAMEDVARDLHMSARTLQRRLQEEGLTYQRVLDEARHQMARYYLGNSVLELNEAAYLLGYEDASSFVRAFRTWEGVPPGEWRDAHRKSLVQ